MLVVAVFATSATGAEEKTEPKRIALWNGKSAKRTGAITVHRPAKGNGAAVVICPGGGYGGLVTGAEGHGIARWLNQHGIVGIVLEYELPKGRPLVPLHDAQRAIRMARANARAWKLNPSRIGIMGFSAGGHLASTAGTHFDAGDKKASNPIDRASCRPDFMVLVYPVITMGEQGHRGSRQNLLGKDSSQELRLLYSNEKQVKKNTPPTYLAHAKDDKVVPPEHSRMFQQALKTHKVASEFLELPSGGHGLNRYRGPMWDAWQTGSLRWLAALKMIPATSQQENKDGTVTVSGLIMPRDDDGMSIHNSDGQFEIEWTEQTKVALDVNTRLFRGLKNGVLHYQVQAAKQMIDFPLPKGPITAIKTVRGGRRLEIALKEAVNEGWIVERGLRLFFGEKPKTEQLPTEGDLRFIGLWNPTAKPRTLSINGKKYEVSLKKGGQTNALLFNVIGTGDCKPFINRARVIGRKRGDVIIADEIHVLPVGDQTASDDPTLPRYLFIGDSISGNYNNGLRKSLDGKYNIHHPPTNCGPSGKGKNSIVEWLGGYKQKGRHWDVISFNFGHWDAGNNKATYQANLESVIAELKKTNAKLIWVTTCPVPIGYPPADDLADDGKAPRRTSGVMAKYLNPWALEVMQRHPQISICDHWQFTKDHEADLYKRWLAGKNVHFGGELADALGRVLAEHVEKQMGVE